MVYNPAEHWQNRQPIDDGAAADEFRCQPFGQQSPALQRILIKLRSLPMPGKYALLVRERHREWVLVRMTGTVTDPIEVIEEHVFHSLEDAERFVFEARLQAHARREEI